MNAPFTFSQSSLQDYADCPRRFQLRYLMQMEWPAVDAEPVADFERRQAEGRAFHRLIQQHRLGVAAATLGNFAGSPTTARWWENYLAADLGIDGYAQRPEMTLVCPVGDHRLMAKYDLIATHDGAAVIYDWKTSSRRPSNESLAVRWQTRVYLSLLAKAGAAINAGQAFAPGRTKMIYWFADFPNEPASFGYDDEQLGRDWSAIGDLVREISAAESFPLTTDARRCRFCVYRSYCDRGSRAAESPDGDSEGDAGDTFDLNFEQIGEIAF